MASVRKRKDRPDHPWVVDYRDPTTKHRRHPAFRTRREAEAFRGTVNTEIRQGKYVARRPIPFKKFTLDWLARTEPTVSPNTHALHEWGGTGCTPRLIVSNGIWRW